MDFNRYLSSAAALHETESAAGSRFRIGETVDGLRVTAFLGRGAFSEVWRVHDLKEDRDYALKLFTGSPGTAAHSRFLTEAHALDEFRHPNLLRRHRLHDGPERTYFTTDVLRPLPERLTEREILRLVNDVLDGLNALHTKGIIHRDLKPANLLLDRTGRTVLADLGVAHIDDADLAKRLGRDACTKPTWVGGATFVGTPRYAAPEQLAGETVTPATDIYALGVIVEELFGGKVPWRWRLLLGAMTRSRPWLRLKSVRAVRRRLQLVRILPGLIGIVITALGVAAAIAAIQLARPSWRELPDSLVEFRRQPARIVITLDGGHYRQMQLRLKPLHGPTEDGKVTMHRHPVFIGGRGTLECPELSGCEVHLGAGVTLITTGRLDPAIGAENLPSADERWLSRLAAPAYVVEPGAKLVFTENREYPAALIR